MKALTAISLLLLCSYAVAQGVTDPVALAVGQLRTTVLYVGCALAFAVGVVAGVLR